MDVRADLPSSGPTSTSLMMPSVTVSAIAPWTSGPAASGAIVSTYRPVSPISYFAHAESPPSGTRTQASTISSAERTFRSAERSLRIPQGRTPAGPFAIGARPG